jgi:hypothetical protein
MKEKIYGVSEDDIMGVIRESLNMGKKKQEALNQEAIDVIHRELNAQIKALSWLAAWDEELRAKDASQEDAPALLEQKIRDLTMQELPTVLRLPSQREVVFDRTASAVADPVVAPNDLLLSYIPNSMAEVDGVLRLEFRQVSTDVDSNAVGRHELAWSMGALGLNRQ